MGNIGYGYGSECHLLRWLGRHRMELDKRVLKAVNRGDEKVEWEDFRFAPDRIWQDAELKGLEFLDDIQFSKIQAAWKRFWPQGRGIHNWDAVGWIVLPNGERELLLVEAKAEANGELCSDCGATSQTSIERIRGSLDEVKCSLGVNSESDWMNGYYQAANRIAVLWFLHQHDLRSHLLNVYFTGDRRDDGGVCPKSETEWRKHLNRQDVQIGLPREHDLKPWMHSLFLPVALQG